MLGEPAEGDGGTGEAGPRAPPSRLERTPLGPTRGNLIGEKSLPWAVNHIGKIVRKLNPQPHVARREILMTSWGVHLRSARDVHLRSAGTFA